MLKPLLFCLCLMLQVSSARADGAIIEAFETLGSDLDDIKTKALNYSSPTAWYRTSVLDVSAAGAGVPVLFLSQAT